MEAMRGHEGRLPLCDALGGVLGEMRVAEAELQILEVLPKTGRKAGAQAQRRPEYRRIAAECLNETEENYSRARDLFIERTKHFGIDETTAKVRFSEAYSYITRRS
jgi:hypothetical protein